VVIEIITLDSHENDEIVYLNFCFENEVSVTCISHTKYAPKVIHGEIADIPYFKFRRLYEENEYEGKATMRQVKFT
jgi:hypothetical protein